ncbi:MAG: CDP-diacylglycerol O-phosphatidyltransferase [Acidobacteria bacterium]|nr:CDP-diacylglycerol O-phosphatidyltransferase [Acidobacteriota bacterium]
MVHAYTASGAVLAFAMTLATIRAQFRFAFLLMVVATVIDATDGALARVARVRERTPAFDGARLDDIVDYLTFVFVPALLIFEAGLLPRDWSAVIVAVMLLSSAYGFSAADAKTTDHFFTGFPSYWNIVALYLFASHLPPTVNGLILLGLSVLVFVRIGYVYPSRTPVLRGLTIALCGIWGVMIILIIAMLPEVSRLLLLTSLFFPLYYVVLSLLLQRRRMRRA